jgi:hypothetical protein
MRRKKTNHQKGNTNKKYKYKIENRITNNCQSNQEMKALLIINKIIRFSAKGSHITPIDTARAARLLTFLSLFLALSIYTNEREKTKIK